MIQLGGKKFYRSLGKSFRVLKSAVEVSGNDFVNQAQMNAAKFLVVEAQNSRAEFKK